MFKMQQLLQIILLFFTLFLTACNDEHKEPLTPKRVLLEGNASIENHNHAQIYFKEGEYEKALEYDIKQLEEDLKYYKEISLEIASDYNDIGLDYDEIKNYDKALEYYLKTMKIDEVVLEENSTECATTFYNVAATYDALHQYSNAIKYYSKALIIDESLLGAYHPEVLAEYESLALVYEHISKYKLSLKYWKKSLAFKEHEYDKYSLDTNETREKVVSLEKELTEKPLIKSQ